jgi:hypothetical protein
MRVTRQSLIRIAKETAQERAYNDKNIIAAYLTGSLLGEDAMLGGTTDIDLVFVQSGQPEREREIVRLTPDFHIDILRRSRQVFKAPRELRADPWLGYEMYDPTLLFEREKFFEFVQASLRAGFEFEGAPLVLQRSRALQASARALWAELSEAAEKAAPLQIRKYLQAVFFAANSLAELNGAPIPERRLLLEFPARIQPLEKPELFGELLGLLGASQINPEKIDRWISEWKDAFNAASQAETADVRIHPARFNYYDKAIKAMLGGETPIAALWPLIQTWTLAAEVLTGEQLKFWRAACGDLELGGASFAQRLQGLDHYLDEIDVLLEGYAAANGLEQETRL